MNNEHWENYSDLFLDEFDDTEEHRVLEKIVGDKKIAAVIKFHLGSDSQNWLDRRVDALDGLTPRECLSTESGKVKLQEVLMRFH
ncbi:antitoxin Xre/MbcA/ParS toxin-binding domain-containing protein [Vibrio quintilis]|uniref:Uncharacterized protein n=1 Tax=Vibrio quintilis TaxID=1117707 RepID=A0A1M7Z363_9VIBR|nr:antitoxin Xre/MbcA/ParS toxin-binding domain-containing protein [Vibrio quintilis]SHO59245.1 hypothetical protein VQ7734_05025 [Vibrio quintilis]